MATSFYDRVKVSVAAAPGTGTVSLGSAVIGYQGFAAAGVADQATVSYAIEDGATWEIGHGTYTASGSTLARTKIIASSVGGSPPGAANFDSSATVALTILAEDLASLGGSGSSSSGAVSATYWRISPTSNDGFGNGVLAMSEFWFTAGGSQLAPANATSSAVQSGNGPGNAYDNNTSTYFATDNQPWELAYQFTKAVTPDGFYISARTDGYYNQGPAQWTIDYSNDGQNWTQLQAYVLSTHWAASGAANTQSFTISGQ